MKTTKEKRINLYISCSTKSDVLAEQKRSINKLRDELNEEYAKNGFVVKINTVGYDDPESREDIYKSFIHRTADIVVFLVAKECDKKEMERLKRELEIIVNRHNKESRPEILIYLPNDAAGSLSDETKKIIKDNQININQIEDTDSLKESVEHNIRAYINSYDMLKNAKSLRRRVRLAKIIVAVFILGAFIGALVKYHQASQPRLLIAGGGSAKNYIEKNFGAIKDPYWIYAPIPSGSAYRLLTEETKMDVKDNLNRDYYTIILSADSAKQEDYLKRYFSSDFLKTGVVIGLHVGYDTLAVYHSKNIFIGTTNVKDSILSIIKNKTNIRIYTTNEASGTLKAFNKFLDTNITPPSDSSVFYSSKCIEDSIWIALGSKYYAPANEDKVTTLIPEKKHVYIYFMKYKSVSSAKYELPKSTEKFLERIHINDGLIDSIKNFQPKTDTTILFNHFCANKE